MENRQSCENFFARTPNDVNFLILKFQLSSIKFVIPNNYYNLIFKAKAMSSVNKTVISMPVKISREIVKRREKAKLKE